MLEIVKPDEIDFDCGVLFGGDYEVSAEEYASLADAAHDVGTKLVPLIDAEGQFVCVATLPVAEWLEKLLSVTEEIRSLVEQNPERFTATPAGRSIIGGERWPPAGNSERAHPLERALAALQASVAAPSQKLKE
jgi:hypothetical protein